MSGVILTILSLKTAGEILHNIDPNAALDHNKAKTAEIISKFHSSTEDMNSNSLRSNSPIIRRNEILWTLIKEHDLLGSIKRTIIAEAILSQLKAELPNLVQRVDTDCTSMALEDIGQQLLRLYGTNVLEKLETILIESKDMTDNEIIEQINGKWYLPKNETIKQLYTEIAIIPEQTYFAGVLAPSADEPYQKKVYTERTEREKAVYKRLLEHIGLEQINDRTNKVATVMELVRSPNLHDDFDYFHMFARNILRTLPAQLTDFSKQQELINREQEAIRIRKSKPKTKIISRKIDPLQTNFLDIFPK